jgi:hypothetical protein
MKKINGIELEIIKELMDNNIKNICNLNKELYYYDIWNKYNSRIETYIKYDYLE